MCQKAILKIANKVVLQIIIKHMTVLFMDVFFRPVVLKNLSVD